jgi:hypothetical protein
MQHGAKQAMPRSTNSLLDEATRVLHELAVNQGLAHSTYGETLQRFGENKIGLSELFKAAGDLYIKEAVQTVWSLVRADINIYASLLAMAGARSIGPQAKADQEEAPSEKHSRRGRR